MNFLRLIFGGKNDKFKTFNFKTTNLMLGINWKNCFFWTEIGLKIICYQFCNLRKRKRKENKATRLLSADEDKVCVRSSLSGGLIRQSGVTCVPLPQHPNSENSALAAVRTISFPPKPRPHVCEPCREIPQGKIQ